MNFLVRKPLSGLKGLFLGEATGELAGLECAEPGTRVSELVVVFRDPVRVSELDAPNDRGLGTGNMVSSGSVQVSPGNLNVIVVALTLQEGVSGSDSESSDSVTSVRNSEFSERVSQEAIGASLGLGGISRLVGWSSESLLAFFSLESFFARSSASKPGCKLPPPTPANSRKVRQKH